MHAESFLEHRVLTLLEFDPRVTRYLEQGICVPWRDSRGGVHQYMPDVVVAFHPLLPVHRFAVTAYEVKPLAILREGWHELAPKYRAVRAVLKRYGVRFRLLTEQQAPLLLAQNVSFLLGYRQGTNDLSPSLHALNARMHELLCIPEKPVTPSRTVGCLSEEERPRALADLWRLVGQGAWHIDLTQPITMNSVLTPIRDLTDSAFSFPQWIQTHDWHR